MASSSDIPPPAMTGTAGSSTFVTYSTLEDVLEDLSSRFILNLPDEELTSLDRVCFQVEQAHWYYEDFIREENPKYPSLPLKKFSAMLFHACPHLHQWSHDHELAFTQFMQYKTRVPVCGAIMINDSWEKCVLVKGWKSSSGWGFPKGKINERESAPNCAVREVLEETGYNLAGKINPEDVIEMSIKEQRISLFIVQGVPEDFSFKTRTRKEISKIEWFKMTDLPTWRRNKTQVGKFYLITPFIGALRNFVNQRRPRAVSRRVLKSKTSQPLVEHAAEETAPPELQDAAQESSSQSSSADNLNTPSPRYIESQVVQTTGEDELRALADTALDPHFARLLTSLTLSAAVKPTEKPLVVTQSVDHSDKPTRAPSRHETASTLSSQSTTLLSPISPATNASQNSHLSEQHSSSVSSSVSPRVSRRTSSTTDISPYMPRATEVPTSAKRLKQIALLQTVAMESARKTPKLERPPTATSAPGLNAAPIIPPSSDPNDLRVIYSSNGPAMGPAAPSAPFPIHDDPFQVRPRTTMAFHRPFHHPNTPGRSSMSQDSLLSLIHGTPRMQGPYLNSYQQIQQQHIQQPFHAHPTGRLQIQPPLLPFQPLPFPPPPPPSQVQTQALPPALPRSFQRPQHDPLLLSILNNKSTPNQ